jgi:hemerythrin superfamily protein
MTTRKSSGSKASKDQSARSSKARGTGNPNADALDMLIRDHREVDALFKEFESIKDSEEDDDEKERLVQQVCEALTIHTTIEEEIFYPAAREALDEEGNDLLDEAAVEHAGAKELIAQLEIAQPSDPLYDAKVTVLAEYIRHHVKEEEGELFPKLRKADFDGEAVGEAMRDRKEELEEQVPSAA